MASTNSVRSVRYVRSGARTIQHVGDEVGFGFALVPVAEPGYYVEPADCHVFVPESALRIAKEAAHVARAKQRTSKERP